MRARIPSDAVSVDHEVPFHDVDALRVVWHGHYLKYMELGRTALLRSRDLDIPVIAAMGYRQLVVETRCRHVFPLHYGDRFRVHTWLTEVEHRLVFAHVIWNLTHDRRSAKASTTIVTTDGAGNLLLETPHAIRDPLALAR